MVEQLDGQFVTAAAQLDMFQYQAAEAAEKAANGNADVTKFVQEIMTDHKDMTKKLTDLAGTSKVQMPKTLSANYQTQLDSLKSATGPATVRTFLQQEVKAYQDAVQLYTAQSKDGKDAAITAYAKAELPNLQKQLTEAQTLLAAQPGTSAPAANQSTSSTTQPGGTTQPGAGTTQPGTGTTQPGTGTTQPGTGTTQPGGKK